MAGRTRPIEKFAAAAAKCSAEVCPTKYKSSQSKPTDIGQQASVYGKCIAKDYNAVYKDKCLAEFLKLKDCYLVNSSIAHLVNLESDIRYRLQLNENPYEPALPFDGWDTT